MDKERAMLAGSLARAAEILVNRQSLAAKNGLVMENIVISKALELGHPKVRTFGIDPHKRAKSQVMCSTR